MPASRSLDEFGKSISIAAELIELEKNYANPPRRADQPAVSGLRGGAAILMVASFEAFLRSTMVEHLSELTIHPPRVAFDKLPDKMQINSIFYCLESAMRGPRYPKLSKKDRIPSIKIACSKIVADIIDPVALSSTQSNPSPETVKQLFADIGVADIFGRLQTSFEREWGRREATTFIHDKLDEIVNRRHRVAHTGNALDITRNQLNESLKFLRILSRLLDKQLRSHVDSLYTS